jgi:cAMP phosphodiesterase
LSGFAINTAAFHATSRPKTVAALPSTVDAMKRHIFNDVIWPNLTDEDGGVGFVTFQRLKEGGDAMVGEGEGRGYIEVCDGLGVRAFKVSHGVCTKSGPSHQHRGSIAGLSDSQPPYNGSVQGSAQEPAYSSTNRSLSMSHQYSAPGTPSATRTSFHAAHPSPHPQLPENVCVVDSTALFIRDCETAQELLFFGDVEPDSLSLHPRNHVVWAEAARKIVLGHLGAIVIECSYDDSQADAFLFGHLNPRHLVAELQTLAAMVEDAHIHKQMEEKGVRKRKQSALNGILLPEHDRKRSRSLISRPVPPYEQHRSSRGSDQGIYDAPANPSGISTPGAEASVQYQQQSYHHGLGVPAFTDPLNVSPDDSRAGPLSPKSVQLGSTPASAAFSNPLPHRGEANLDTAMPLKGIRVIIIHVKDTLRDGPHVSERILEQLQDYEINLQRQGQGLGCDFVISKSGESYWV